MASEAYARLWGRSGDGQIDALVSSVPARIGRALPHSQQEDPGFIPIGASKSISKHHATLDWNEEKGRFELLCCSKNGMAVNGVQFSNGEVAGLTSHSAIRMGDVCVYFLLPTDKQPGMDQGGEPKQEKAQHFSTPTAAAHGEADDADEEGVEEEMSLQESNKLPEEGSMRQQSEEDADSQAAGSQFLGEGSQRTTPSKQLTYPEMIARAFESPELQEKAMTEGLLAKEVVQWVLVEYFDNDTSRRQKVQNAVSNYLCKTYEKIASHPSQTRNVRWRKPDGTLRASSLQQTHSYAQLRSVDEEDVEPKPKKPHRATIAVADASSHYDEPAESSTSIPPNDETSAFWLKFSSQLPLSAREMMPKLSATQGMEEVSEEAAMH